MKLDLKKVHVASRGKTYLIYTNELSRVYKEVPIIYDKGMNIVGITESMIAKISFEVQKWRFRV